MCHSIQSYERFYDIKGIDIILTKNISRGSGLGSGSSNAAAVLKSINKIYDLMFLMMI